MSRVSAVLFDLDGTLLDHRSAARCGLQRLLERMPVDPSRIDELMPVWLDLERHFFEQYLNGTITFTEQRKLRLTAFRRHTTASDVTNERVTELFSVYVDAYEANWRPFHDVVSCIQALRTRGLSLGVLTNGSADQQWRKVYAIDLDGFDAVVTSEECGYRKPDKEAFLAACAALGTEPERAVFVGDDLEVDGFGAIRAGMRAFWLDRDLSAGEGTKPSSHLRKGCRG